MVLLIGCWILAPARSGSISSNCGSGSGGASSGQRRGLLVPALVAARPQLAVAGSAAAGLLVVRQMILNLSFWWMIGIRIVRTQRQLGALAAVPGSAAPGLRDWAWTAAAGAAAAAARATAARMGMAGGWGRTRILRCLASAR